MDVYKALYTTRAMRRVPVHEVAHRNRWGAPLGFEILKPLWPGEA